MNAHNEQHDPASAVVKQNLTTQPAAAQEAVAYWRVTFRMYPENIDCCETFVRGPDRPTLDTLGISPRPVQIISTEPLYAAPVTAAPAVAYMIDGRTEQGLTFDKAAAETMAFANGGTVRALGFVGGTTAAPGIDHAAEIESLKWQLDRANNAIEVLTRTQNVRKKAAEVIDASPKGGIDPSWSLHDRVEFALRDAGFDLDEAAFVAEAASVANGDLESPKGGSEARDAARYRWLREFAVNGSIGIPFHGWLNCDEPASEWDSAIDAAMQAGDAEVQP